jgi:hypothetical protein
MNRPPDAPVSARVRRAADSMTTLLEHLNRWDAQRAASGVCDLMLGNPQELPLPGHLAVGVDEHGCWPPAGGSAGSRCRRRGPARPARDAIDAAQITASW